MFPRNILTLKLQIAFEITFSTLATLRTVYFSSLHVTVFSVYMSCAGHTSTATNQLYCLRHPSIIGSYLPTGVFPIDVTVAMGIGNKTHPFFLRTYTIQFTLRRNASLFSRRGVNIQIFIIFCGTSWLSSSIKFRYNISISKSIEVYMKRNSVFFGKYLFGRRFEI